MKALALIPLAGLFSCELQGLPADQASEARALITEYGCASCHAIPEVPGAGGRTGPPLTAMADQVYVAGVLPNTAEDLAAFIADPQAADPRSAMPDLGVTPEEARLIAAFLYAASGGRE